METAFGMHESGAMVQIFIIDGVPYVMLLESSAVTDASGQWWGCQTVTKDLVNMRVLDIPGGKTTQFDRKAYLKQYYPRKGAGSDPRSVTKATHPFAESMVEAAIRETREETHGVVCPIQCHIQKTWAVDGGFVSSQGDRSQTAVVLNVATVTILDLVTFQVAFIKNNAKATQLYNRWAKTHPKTKLNENDHWDRRPEFSGMAFVTWSSFRAAIVSSARQLDAYQKDKVTQPKGVVSHLVDYLGCTRFEVIRSWPVLILKDLLDEIEAAIKLYTHTQCT